MTKQNRFEAKEVHPRVAALLQKDDWLFLHECRLDDGRRMDFLALNPRSGHVAIVECKIEITSSEDVARQVNHYHSQLGFSDAFKWVFVWVMPSAKKIHGLMRHDIQVYEMDNEPDVTPISTSVDTRGKRVFWETFKRYHPDVYEDWFGGS